MIIVTELGNGLIERRSDKNVYIRNDLTGHEYEVAVDWDDINRRRRGVLPVTYTETDKPIVHEEGEGGVSAYHSNSDSGEGASSE